MEPQRLGGPGDRSGVFEEAAQGVPEPVVAVSLVQGAQWLGDEGGVQCVLGELEEHGELPEQVPVADASQRGDPARGPGRDEGLLVRPPGVLQARVTPADTDDRSRRRFQEGGEFVEDAGRLGGDLGRGGRPLTHLEQDRPVLVDREDAVRRTCLPEAVQSPPQSRFALPHGLRAAAQLDQGDEDLFGLPEQPEFHGPPTRGGAGDDVGVDEFQDQGLLVGLPGVGAELLDVHLGGHQAGGPPDGFGLLRFERHLGRHHHEQPQEVPALAQRHDVTGQESEVVTALDESGPGPLGHSLGEYVADRRVVGTALEQRADAYRVLVPEVATRADHADQRIIDRDGPAELLRELVDERLESRAARAGSLEPCGHALFLSRPTVPCGTPPFRSC